MKKLLILVFLLSVSTSGYAWPFGKKQPKPKPEVISVAPAPKETAKPTISDGRQLINELSAELRKAKQENESLKNSLQKANENVNAAELKATEVQKAADALKEWGIIQQAEAQKFIEKYNNAVKRYHRLKLIAALIAAAVGVLVGIQFINLAPPPYNLGIPFGGAAFFAALVWFFL